MPAHTPVRVNMRVQVARVDVPRATALLFVRALRGALSDHVRLSTNSVHAAARAHASRDGANMLNEMGSPPRVRFLPTVSSSRKDGLGFIVGLAVPVGDPGLPGVGVARVLAANNSRVERFRPWSSFRSDDDDNLDSGDDRWGEQSGVHGDMEVESREDEARRRRD